MPYISIYERLASEYELFRKTVDTIKFEIRCASPAIITKFDVNKQTVCVQLVTKERIALEGVLENIKLPELGDIPIYMPRAGNFIITMPIKVGDECLVVFSDTCFDSWFQSGGVDNEQISGRRHDLSDAIALCGIWNQKQVIDNYSTDSMELKTLDGQTTLRIKEGEVTIISDSIKLGDSSGLKKLIDDRLIELYNAHTHTYSPGPGTPTATGVPNALLSASTVATVNTEAK